MSRGLTKISGCAAALLAATSAFTLGLCSENVSLTPSARVSYRVLQLVNTGGLNTFRNNYYFNADSTSLNGAWVHTIEGEFSLTAKFRQRTTIHVGYQAHVENLPTEGGPAIRRQVTSALTEGKAEFKFGDVAAPSFVLTGGMFNFKYNPQARDLGEYLLQCGVYPGFVMSGIEKPSLVGFDVHSGIIPNLSQDLLVTSEVQNVPYFDVSLSYLGSYRFGTVLELGAGIMFYRLISVKEENTTPPPTVFINSRDDGSFDTTTAHFTLRGIKTMARLTFDPKPLFRSEILGAEDLRLYAECAILGLKDYPVYYNDLGERIPVMVGVNVPAFKLLDYCAVEAEWYGSPHNNNPYENVLPYSVEGDLGSTDDIKWAVSIRRTVTRQMALSARVASDHLRFEDGTGWIEKYERTVSPSQWYWYVKCEFAF